MNARSQLNAFYLIGCLLAAITVGLMFQSWMAFAVSLAVVSAIKIQDGGIRLIQRPRSRQGFRGRRSGHAPGGKNQRKRTFRA